MASGSRLVPVRELAQRHQRERQRLAQVASSEGTRLWRGINPDALSESWSSSMTRLLAVTIATQRAAAASADPYTDSVLAEQGADVAVQGRVNPQAFAGVASDGRPMGALLLSPVIVAKTALSRGATVRSALASGQATLEMILRTQIADAGRVADGVAVTARPRMGYIRYVSPPSCPRCAILAGRWYRFSSGFQRHPQCDCIHTPAPEGTRPGTLNSSPRQLLEEGQIQGLSKADTKAILDDGADMNRLVNARRGMSTASKGRRSRRSRREDRLMPEQIYREAKGSRTEAMRLLQENGFIL